MNFSTLSRLPYALRKHIGLVAIVILLGVVCAGFAMISIHPRYSASANVLMVADSQSLSSAKTTTASTPILSGDLATVATSSEILKSIQRKGGSTETLPALRAKIKAKVSVESMVLALAFRAKTSDEAIKMANILADEIVGYYRNLATRRFDSLIHDLESQLSETRNTLDKYDSAIGQYARAYPYIDTESPATNGVSSIYQRLITLTTEKDELDAQIRSETTNLHSSHDLLVNAGPQAERDLVENDTIFKNLHEQYAKDYQELRHLKAFANRNYPGVVELEHTVAVEARDVERAKAYARKKNLTSNAAYSTAMDTLVRNRSQLLGDQEKLVAIKQQLELLNAQIGGSDVANKVAKVRRDRQSSEAAYAQLSIRLAESKADRAQAATMGSLVVMDYASFATPDAMSNGKIVAVIIMIVFLWISCSLALLLDKREKRIMDNPSSPSARTPTDISSAIQRDSLNVER